ncbi:MAG: hypothetical protein K0Q77_1641 [Anaerosporomusa subterranea]|nr:hypothetical protein [Anaerosporomusa subterranea]
MNQTTNQMTNQTTNQMTNQTAPGLINQSVMAQTAPTSQVAAQGQNTTPMQNSQFSQIIQQVDELKQSLHNFIDQEDFPDARMIAASGRLEGQLNQYYQLAVEKENQKPGLETF